MRRRGYLELTPEELRARRLAFCGLALFIMPPLLTLCHMEQFMCQANWSGGTAQLLSLWPMFPWLLPVAACMLAGGGLTIVGGVLLLVLALDRPPNLVATADEVIE